MATTLVYVTYVVASVLVVLFGAAACFLTFVRHRTHGPDTPEFFLTARNSVGTFRIAWSFYAAAMGSWTLFSPASYAYTAGWFGLLFYALASGLPILIQGFLGPVVQRRKPDLLSFTDFVNHRFGRVVQIWVALLMLLNMGIAMTAEYTAVGDLFELVVGTERVPIVVIIGVVSMIYTAYGGLYISIITDQWQAALGLTLAAILIIWTAVTFRGPLPRPLPDNLAINEAGLSSIAVMPISLFSASVFSEAIWQRCWASASDAKLRIGAVWGAAQVTVLVFIFGFGGFLAVWSGLWQPSGPDDPGNTILFALLNSQGQQIWITAIVAVLAATMSESAIDSLQNAIVDNISGSFLKGLPLIWIRVLVVILSVPVIIVSLQGYGIINLFLLANLVTTTSTLPILLGLLEGEFVERIITPLSVLFGCWFSFASLIVWAYCMAGSWGLSFNDSMHKVFFEAYDWRSFLLALGCSLVGMSIMAALENLVLRPLLKGVCPSYFEPRQAPATLPHQKFSGESDRSPTGTSAYPGGALPSAPKMAI
ncbi:g3212 [Coccomyxa elongata]